MQLKNNEIYRIRVFVGNDLITQKKPWMFLSFLASVICSKLSSFDNSKTTYRNTHWHEMCKIIHGNYCVILFLIRSNIEVLKLSCQRITVLKTCLKYLPYLFDWLDSLRPSHQFWVMSGRVFLVWTSIKLSVKSLAKGHKAVLPMRLKPITPRSPIKPSTTEPHHS